MSTTHRSARAQAVFAEALERPETERGRYVEEACGEDVDLCREINELLQAHQQAGAFLEEPITPSSMGDADESPPSLPPGTMLGAFRIVSQLGAGGMATVYAARDTRLDRSVAIKVLTPRLELGEASRKRFEREALAISRLSHPHICSLYDVGRARVPASDDELSYLVMERVDGETLADLLTRGPLPNSRAVSFAIEIAEALACAHGEGIVHRDLKPQNIMVTKTGTKLLDFGLAAFTTGSAQAGATPSVLTRPGIMVGTVQYMAPEQIQGLDPDTRADLFSLGLVLYEMIAGRRAFSRATTVETLHAILHDDPPPVPESTPAPLKTLLAHCLEKDRNLRFQTARDVVFALKAFAFAPGMELPASKRHLARWATWVLGGVGLVAAGALLARNITPPASNLGDYTLAPFAADSYSPAWSPDGKSVAFVRRDENGEPQIVVRSSEGSATTELTAGASGAGQPFWSRDGRRVFFGSAPIRSVSVTGGEIRTEFPDANAADVSPDGRTFALWRVIDTGGRVTASLWTGPREGPFLPYKPAPLTMGSGTMPIVVRFSPDGTAILLSVAGAGAGVSLVPYPPAPGKTPTRIFTDRIESATDMSWMPDSRHVMLGKDILWLGDTRTGTLQRVLAGTTSVFGPSVSPAGNRLLFQDVAEKSRVIELPLTGGRPKVLAAATRHAGSAVWSPRGDRLAYVTDREGPDEIWTRTKEEFSDQRLVRPEDFPDLPPSRIFSVRYSPDGERLSFVTTAGTASGGFRSRLWVMPSRGGTPRPITNESEGVNRASWMAEGQSLLARVYREGRVQFCEVHLDTSVPHRPIPLPPEVHVWHLESSPSGALIAGVGWIRQRNSGSTIVFARDGSQVRELPPLESPALLWSRDERTIYGVAVENGQSVLRALDVAAGRVRRVAEYGAKMDLMEPINDSLQFMPTPDGKGFVTTSFEHRYDIWMLKDFRPPRESWWRWR
jgi:serine/threonine protein kinase